MSCGCGLVKYPLDTTPGAAQPTGLDRCPLRDLGLASGVTGSAIDNGLDYSSGQPQKTESAGNIAQFVSSSVHLFSRDLELRCHVGSTCRRRPGARGGGFGAPGVSLPCLERAGLYLAQPPTHAGAAERARDTATRSHPGLVNRELAHSVKPHHRGSIASVAKRF